MSELSPDQFGDFFSALHDRVPYSWQRRLAARAIEGQWPGAVDLPTGSGKTACIDIAIFALACQTERPVAQRSAPRRIFFCVNRRVIVDEAHQRAQRIAEELWRAEREPVTNHPILRKVADSLRRLAGTCASDDVPPLDVLELRGGIYRDNRWARSATQPTVVCTTIDQLGSRLLFRGYGVSPNAAPVQAALIAYDSLVLLDEAHISEPFRQSLNRVASYLDPERWAERAIGARPVTVVPMTATPPAGVKPDNVVGLDNEDRKNEALTKRLSAMKPALLRAVPDVGKAAVEEADHYAKDSKVAIGIIVNRVATAKEIHRLLRERHPQAELELVIGSMRPIDRDAQTERLVRIVGRCRPDITEKTSFVVATQCLEVGADYDFDVLISECASLDALRQRFGRLNRQGRPIKASAVILAKTKELKPEPLDEDKPADPIYGNALVRTWDWLWTHAGKAAPEAISEVVSEKSTRPKKAKSGVEIQTTEDRVVDFGIDAFSKLLYDHTDDGRIPRALLAPSALLNAPVMLPAHIDFWCQTSPRPVPDPDITLFIHGQPQVERDVQVCWRADLVDDGFMKDEDWRDTVALLPPTAAECMSVPISRVRRWLSGEKVESPNDGDLLGTKEETDERDSTMRNRPRNLRTLAHRGVLWRGAKVRGAKDKSPLLTSPDDLRPGDTIVLPVEEGGWADLGHIPERSRPTLDFSGESKSTEKTGPTESFDPDVAEVAFQRARGKAVLRLHPSRLPSFPRIPEIESLIERVGDTDDPVTLAELCELMQNAAGALSNDYEVLQRKLKLLASQNHRLVRERYPDDRGIVISTRKRVETNMFWSFLTLDDGEDDTSRTSREQSVTLADHTAHVVEALERSLSLLPTSESAVALSLAAALHDWGKADDRFQAMLLRTGRTNAWLVPGPSRALVAKSDGMLQTLRERYDARIRVGLPAGFRHEMLSVHLAERTAKLPANVLERDLILHLIAAHHGFGRPFAPVVLDDEPPNVAIDDVAISSADRLARPPHRLDSGIGERFWRLTQRFGWWGLAFLEALLRLADQEASADEDSGKYAQTSTSELEEASA